MATNRNNFFGLGIIPSSSTSNSVPGDIEYLTSDGKLHIRGVSANDALVQEALAQTLTNKTLTAPVIATIVNTGTLTLPTSTDTLLGRATTDTLTNKSISGATNTLTAIPNSSLTNSSVTINGSSVSLGGSVTVSATATNALTIGTGLTGTSYNGSSAVTVAIDSTVATLTGTQTLTNKTLTAPTIDVVNGPSAANLGINATTGNSVNLTVASAVIAQATSTGIALGSSKTLTFSSNSQVVTLKADPSASASYTVTLPAAAPTSNTALVYNGTNFVWSTAGGGTSSNSNYTVDTFSGNGSQTVFTLSVDPLTKNNTLINISGVVQQKSTYTVTGTTLTFSSAPPAGTGNIEVVSGTAAPVNSAGYTSSVQTSLAAGATLTTSLVAGLQAIEVAGASSAITLSTTPFGTSAPTDKAVITLIGRSSTNTVTITNNDISFGTIVNGTATLGLYNSIQFMYMASVSRWVEQFRN